MDGRIRAVVQTTHTKSWQMHYDAAECSFYDETTDTHRGKNLPCQTINGSNVCTGL